MCYLIFDDNRHLQIIQKRFRSFPDALLEGIRTNRRSLFDGRPKVVTEVAALLSFRCLSSINSFLVETMSEMGVKENDSLTVDQLKNILLLTLQRIEKLKDDIASSNDPRLRSKISGRPGTVS